MSSIQYRLKKRLYRLKAYRRKGFGIHSPYTFNLITNVIEAKLHYYAFAKLKETRKIAIKLLKRSCKSSAISSKRANKVKDEIYGLKKSEALDRLVFRLMNFNRTKNPAYLGNGLSYTTAYMASVDSRVIVNCIGHGLRNTDIPNKIYHELLSIKNVVSKELSDIKECDFLVISDTVSIETLDAFLNNFTKHLKTECTIVFLNMYKTKKLMQSWKQLKQHETFRLSIDLFHVGILVARAGMQKQDYVRKYRF